MQFGLTEGQIQLSYYIKLIRKLKLVYYLN